MRKLITTIAVLTVMVLTVGLMGTAALAAPEEVLTLDIADGSLVISATGYSVNGAAETPYTGSYIITGTANTTGPHKTLTVTGVAADATVTLKDLTIITNGPPALTLYAPVKATGKLTVGAGGVAIAGSDIVITGDAAITGTANAPVISANNASITCASLDLEGNLAISAGTVVIDSTGNVRLKGSSPAIAGSAAIKAGGNVTMESGNVCISGSSHSVEADGSIQMTSNGAPVIYGSSAVLKAGGDIALNSNYQCLNAATATLEAGGSILLTSTGAYSASSGNAMFKAAKDVTITAGANSALYGSAQNIDAGGNVTITNKSEHPTINAGETTISAGGKLDISNTGAGPVVSGGNFTVTKAAAVSVTADASSPTIYASAAILNSTGDLTVTGGYMVISATDLEMTAGGNVTVIGTGNAPTISASRSADLNAAGNLTVQSSHMAFVTGTLTATAGGNVKISGTANSVPLISSGDKNIIKAKGSVELTQPNFGIVLNGSASEVEGSSVKITAGEGGSAFCGKVSLKATAGDLIVTGADTEQPLFADQVPTLYAAEKISLTAASDWICTGIPEMTFGQSATMGGNTESLFIGLDQLAVEGSIDLLPLLKFISPDMEGADIVFTAALNGEQKKEILAAGTYNCNVAVTRDGVTLNIPFNLIVREAKPAVNPDTGDQSPLAALVALTLASALGMGLILSGKKYSA